MDEDRAEAAGDHRRWLRELELAHFEPTSPGMPYWLPHGVVVMRALQDHWRRAHERWGYQEVSTPVMARTPLYASSGHLEHFADSMFFCDTGDGDRYGLKPVNCPGTMLIFRSRRRSYRELPMRLACYDLLHRSERSGVLTGLLRVQAFHQDDAHIFLPDEQARPEIVDLLRLAERLYAGFGLDFELRLGGAPEGRLGDEADWARAQAVLADALADFCGPGGYAFEPGEGAFYGPKIDLLCADSLGRRWQLGTVQLDYQTPARMGCRYVGADGAEDVPAMIHRALLGSFERFLGVLLEHTDGRLPAFLAPVQLRLVAVSERHAAAASAVAEAARGAGLRVELHRSNQRLGAQVRDARLRRIPFLGVIGEREIADGTVSVRAVDGADQGRLSPAGLLKLLGRACRPPAT